MKNYRKTCQRCETKHMFCKSICAKTCYNCFLLTIRSCHDNSFLRRTRFVKVRKFYLSMFVRSTNKIISSILFFVFTRFVVAMSFERMISFSWRTFSTFVKRHVLNCSIYEQKKNEIFFSNTDMFSKLSCFFYNRFVQWNFFFSSFDATKKRFSFFRVIDKWWWSNFLTIFFYFCNFFKSTYNLNQNLLILFSKLFFCCFFVFLNDGRIFWKSHKKSFLWNFFEKRTKSRYRRFLIEFHFFLSIFFSFRVDTSTSFFSDLSIFVINN